RLTEQLERRKVAQLDNGYPPSERTSTPLIKLSSIVNTTDRYRCQAAFPLCQAAGCSLEGWPRWSGFSILLRGACGKGSTPNTKKARAAQVMRYNDSDMKVTICILNVPFVTVSTIFSQPSRA